MKYNVGDTVDVFIGNYDYYKNVLRGKIIKVENYFFSKRYYIDVGIVSEQDFYVKYCNATQVLKVKYKDMVRKID